MQAPRETNRGKSSCERAYLDHIIQLRGTQHIFTGARQIAWTVPHPDSSNCLALTFGQLYNECTLVFTCGLEDSQWRASISEPPVGECGLRRRLWDSDRL